MSQTEVLTIKCPICLEQHQYKLEVSRVYTLSMATINYETKRKYFTRLFTCKKNKEDFQARFSITYPSNAEIESVEVKGHNVEDNNAK